MRVIDFHCDTPSRIYDPRRKRKLANMGTPERTAGLSPYVQLSASFCPVSCENEEGFALICEMLECWQSAAAEGRAYPPLKTAAELKKALEKGQQVSVLTLEDARTLNGELSRVDLLFERGVRLITPLWRDDTVIGGAWNSSEGLTPFGEAAAERFLELGGILDVSHASRASHAQIVALCRRYGRAPVATHSNAFALTNHNRNLTDEQIREIGLLGGVIGLNFYPNFLTLGDESVTMRELALHLRHVMDLGGESVCVLGSDFDGMDALPEGISSAADLPRFAEYLQKNGFSADFIDRFFFENGKNYLMKNLPQGTDV